jgi:hypothetical protein
VWEGMERMEGMEKNGKRLGTREAGSRRLRLT